MSSILLRFSSQSSDITYRVHNAHRSAHLLQQQTSITVYRLTTKENKLSFCFLFAENKWKTTVSVFRIYIYMDKYWNGSIYSIYIYISISLFVYIQYMLCICIWICICISINTYMLPFQTVNKKIEAQWFSLIRLPFAHRADGSLSFVHLFTKKEMEVYI
jgi:hypothetical protein